MTPEGKVKKRVKEILTKMGAYWTMPIGSVFSRNGVPDFLCCYHGWFVAIETKAGSGKTTKLQDYELARIKEAGGISIVINETNIDILEDLIRVCSERPDSSMR